MSSDNDALAAEGRLYAEWESLYRKTVLECLESGLRVYRFNALLQNAARELSQDQAVDLARAFRSSDKLEAGDAYPLVALSPDGRIARVYKMTKDLVRVCGEFAWDGQSWQRGRSAR
jgi:hypothetical protein